VLISDFILGQKGGILSKYPRGFANQTAPSPPPGWSGRSLRSEHRISVIF
jgi:hypothetical protein